MPQDALTSIVTHASVAVAPLRDIHTADQAVAFFKQLGYSFSPGSMGGALTAVTGKAGEVVAAAQQLLAASDDNARITAAKDLIARVAAAADAIKQLETQLKAAGGNVGGDVSQFARRLLDFLILDYLDKQQGEAHELLHLAGLIEHEENPGDGKPSRLIHWERFGPILTQPGKVFDDVYQWQTAFNAAEFLKRLAALMRAATLPGGLYPQADSTRTMLANPTADLQELRFPIFQRGFTPDTYAQFGVTFSPAEAVSGKKAGIALLPYIMGAAAFDFTVCDRGDLVFKSTADIKGVGLVIRPPFDAEGLLNLTGAFGTEIQVHEKANRAEELVLFGSSGGSRLAVQGLGVSFFARNPQGKLDFGVEGQIQTIRLVVKGGEGDGFVDNLLSGLNIQAEAQLGLGYSLLGGFTISGGAQLAIQLPAHIDLGPVKIDSLLLGLAPAADHIKADAGLSLHAGLGPLQATVENVGVSAVFGFQQGNLGPANVSISFKAPTGVGLSLDAGVIKGGGFLSVDPDRGEYAGVLELVFGEINLKALGMITTTMPDGSKGFSLLIIITAEFTPGIQLGFGFTLLGVGGLIGLNRTIRIQPIIDGVRTGAINSVMFPRDVIANAARIISDLRAFFPPEEGKFLIGPMAKLGWGTPTLVSLSLGILIEVPGNIAIVGVLKVVLPDLDAPILVLQVNFAGAIEFDRKRIYFFAALFESRVLSITIEGQMGMLAAFGDDANFVLSVGGFHAQYTPPPLPFPTPQRISLNIANTPAERIRAEGYFAVTSNTVQFGAAAELTFGFDDFAIQGHVSFDALFQFSPFHFAIDTSASVSLKAFGIGMFSLRLQFTLEGPTPWRAHGKGSISLFFFDISADFDVTWGETRNTTLPPIAVMPLLAAEFDKADNWRALPPASSNLLVSLRKIGAAGSLVLHPVGSLRVTQKAVPLDFTIDRVGSQTPSDANTFALRVVGTGIGRRQDLLESFAPAQFENLDDADKLSRPGFELMHGGIELGVSGQELASGKSVKRIVRYEEVILDNNFKRFPRRFRIFNGTLFEHFLGGSSVARSTLSQAARQKLQPFADKVTIGAPGYTVALTSNNQAFSTSATFTSSTMANDFMAGAVRADPTLADALHVIPQHEVIVG